MSMTVQRRPFGVAFLSWLFILTGLAQIIAGIVLLLVRDREDVHAQLRNVSTGEVTTIAVITIILGVISWLVAGGLRSGAGWARFLVALGAVLHAAALVWSVFSHHGLHWYQAVLPTAIYLLVAGYLYGDEDAKSFFSGV